MGRLKSLARKDLLHATRENSLVYALICPLVLAVILRLFLPSMEGTQITFAVELSVPEEVVAQIATYGKVERLDGVEALKERVLRFDDVPGIYLERQEYRVMLEGNEDETVRELPGLIVDHIRGGMSPLDVEVHQMGSRTSLAREYSAILLALTCIAMGGLAVGLSIVDDRETGTLRALSVSPLQTSGYLAGKSVFGLSTAFALSLAATAIVLGAGADYAGLALPLGASLLWGLATGFAMGYVCPNQLTAIALLKLLALVLLGVPTAAIFVPEAFKWALYPFPNYWSFEAMRRVLVGEGASASGPVLLTAALSGTLLALLFPAVGRKFRM